MTKGIIVVDIPDVCFDCCMFSDNAECKVNDLKYVKINALTTKPEWCPIKPVPEKKSMDLGQTVVNAARNEGWNTCIDQILKGE